MANDKINADVERLHEINSLLRPFIKRPSTGQSLTFEQYRILHVLVNEKVNTSELARRLKVGQSMVSIQISRLLTQGLISDETLASDRRYHVFEITDDGKKMHDEVASSLIQQLPAIKDQIKKIVNE